MHLIRNQIILAEHDKAFVKKYVIGSPADNGGLGADSKMKT